MMIVTTTFSQYVKKKIIAIPALSWGNQKTILEDPAIIKARLDSQSSEIVLLFWD